MPTTVALEDLRKSLVVLKACTSPAVGIYTCGGYIFLTGSISGALFLLDTHSIGENLGGTGVGALVVFPVHSNQLWSMCQWIDKRLRSSGVVNDGNQSFSIMSRVARYVLGRKKCVSCLKQYYSNSYELCILILGHRTL